jgi:uncharacterized protein with FMN-binding domain
MKRALAAIVATVAGLVWLLDFRTHAARQSVLPPVAATAPSSSASQAPSAKSQTRSVTGSSVGTPYGDVEVRVTFTGAEITDVVPVRLPDSNGVDQEIDQQAVPILIQETLTAQSASIQAVSGASYTSDGYIQSLQSALDKAK